MERRASMDNTVKKRRGCSVGVGASHVGFFHLKIRFLPGGLWLRSGNRGGGSRLVWRGRDCMGGGDGFSAATVFERPWKDSQKG